MEKKKNHNLNFKLFEEHYFLVLFKASIISVAICFVIKPLIIDKIIFEKGFDFLNKDGDQYLYYSIILFLSFTFGFIHYNVKKAFITVIDLTIITLLVFTPKLQSEKLILYPQTELIKYIHIILIGWIVGSIMPGVSLAAIFTFLKNIPDRAYELGIQSVTRQLKELNSLPRPKKSSIILDMSISEIAKQENTNERVLDSKGLNYLPLAQNILSACEEISSKKSISIGINGDWGSGKSSLIDLIKFLINEQNKLNPKIHVLEFKPWLYEDENNIMLNFFKLWKANIRNLRVQMAFEDYAQYLTGFQFSSTKWDIFGLFKNKDSQQETKEIIINHLSKRNDKYIVIIDDLDRVEANEILEVAKLTRAIGDFPNTIYLLCYDRKYIDSLLEKKLVETKGSNYFDKIVSIEFKVPKIDSKGIKSQLILLLQINSEFIKQYDASFDTEALINTVEKLEENILFNSYLPTLRDVKRFLNALLLRYSAISQINFLPFEYIFVAELYFYKNKENYDKIYIKKNEVVDYLLHPLVDKSILQDISNLNGSLLQKITVGLAPYTVNKIFDAYYSYLDNNSFSSSDVNHIFSSNNTKLIENAIEDGHAEQLLIGMVRLVVDIPDEFTMNYMDRVERIYMIGKLNNLISLKSTLFSDVQIRNITEVFFNSWLKLSRVRKGGYSDDEVKKLKEDILQFGYKFPLYNADIDGNKIPFNTAPYTFSKEKRFDDKDDTTYNKVFDLNSGEFSFEFPIPQIKHWRFGFKLSETVKFPIITTERTPVGYNLFHIGLDTNRNDYEDKENIRATYYLGTSEVKTGLVHDISFTPEEFIKVIVSKSSIGVNIKIKSNDNFIASMLLESTQNCNFIKLYAWADNHSNNDGKALELEVTTSYIKNPPNMAIAKSVKYTAEVN